MFIVKLWTYFTPFSSVSVLDFEQVNVYCVVANECLICVFLVLQKRLSVTFLSFSIVCVLSLIECRVFFNILWDLWINKIFTETKKLPKVSTVFVASFSPEWIPPTNWASYAGETTRLPPSLPSRHLPAQS